MRTCLITPPSVFLLDERVFINLGILKVAAVLEQAGDAVDMLDLSGIQNYEEMGQFGGRLPQNIFRSTINAGAAIV